MLLRPPSPTLFPYTTLFRSYGDRVRMKDGEQRDVQLDRHRDHDQHAVAGAKTFRFARHPFPRSEEHTSELQSPCNLVCRLLLEKKTKAPHTTTDLGKSQPHR